MLLFLCHIGADLLEERLDFHSIRHFVGAAQGGDKKGAGRMVEEGREGRCGWSGEEERDGKAWERSKGYRWMPRQRTDQNHVNLIGACRITLAALFVE